MYKYLIAFVLSMPLIGIWLVEHGEYAMSVGVPGEANGATEAFAIFVAAVVLVALASGGRYRLRRRQNASVATSNPALLNYRDRECVHFAKNLLLLTLAFLLMMLFAFGGINVWLGTIEKGLFRATLGPFGALAYLMTKFAIPALFAYATLLFAKSTRSRQVRALWLANAAMVFIAGSTWGFKTTGVFMLLPGLLILNWTMSAKRLVTFCAVFIGTLMLFFFWFDAQLMEDVNVVPFLATRLTVLQGDVAWYVYGLYAAGETLPNYWPTVIAAAGDTVLSILGVSKENHVEWMKYHYDWMITHLAGVPLENIANGHSITATPFAEGIVAGGWWGAMLFAVLAGLLVGRTYYHLDRAIKTGFDATAAILSTYFCFQIFSWLNGGAITQLFHVSVLVYLMATYALLRAMRLKPRKRTSSRQDRNPGTSPQPV